MSADQLFDDTRKALRFALNASDVRMPKPAMTVAMVEGLKKRMKPARRRKKSEALAVAMMEAEGDERDMVDTARRAFTQRRDMPKGLDRAAQAGLILQAFARLDYVHQIVLRARLVRPAVPCACGRPCCSGWATTTVWSRAIDEVCLKLHMSVVDASPKSRKTRGLSTAPNLRRLIVLGYFTRREMRLVDLAKAAECTAVTAAKHKAMIHEWLEQTENDAWIDADAILGNAGIVGSFEDE